MCHRATNHCMFNDRPGTSWIPLAIYPCSVLPLYPFRVDFRFFICAKRRVWTCDRAKTPALVMDQRLCRMLGTLRVSSKFSPFFGKLRFGDQVLKKTWEARKKNVNTTKHRTPTILGFQVFQHQRLHMRPTTNIFCSGFSSDLPGSEAWTMLYTMLGCDCDVNFIELFSHEIGLGLGCPKMEMSENSLMVVKMKIDQFDSLDVFAFSVLPNFETYPNVVLGTWPLTKRTTPRLIGQMKNYVIRCFTWFTRGGMSSFRALLSWWTRCQSRWTLPSTKSITC